MSTGVAFAERLQAQLATAGINQAELGRRAGVTRAYVGRLLAGAQAAPTAEVVGALAEALSLDAVARLRLFLAAGLVPEELAMLATESAVARLLVVLASTTPAAQARLERLLLAVLDVIEAPTD